MASQPPRKYHDEATLVALEQALKDVCQVLTAHDPARNWENDAEVQQALAEKLMDLADAGVRDPEELCSRMLQGFDRMRRIKSRRAGVIREANICRTETLT